MKSRKKGIFKSFCFLHFTDVPKSQKLWKKFTKCLSKKRCHWLNLGYLHQIRQFRLKRHAYGETGKLWIFAKSLFGVNWWMRSFMYKKSRGWTELCKNDLIDCLVFFCNRVTPVDKWPIRRIEIICKMQTLQVQLYISTVAFCDVFSIMTQNPRLIWGYFRVETSWFWSSWQWKACCRLGRISKHQRRIYYWWNCFSFLSFLGKPKCKIKNSPKFIRQHNIYLKIVMI